LISNSLSHFPLFFLFELNLTLDGKNLSQGCVARALCMLVLVVVMVLLVQGQPLGTH
jgi:hypothetical protein